MGFIVHYVCLCADRGELHRVAVVGQNASLLQEIPLFAAQEPVINILLHQVEPLHAHSHKHADMHAAMLINIHPCASRARLWWAARCLWLKSRLKAAPCTPPARCVPEPEVWAASGAQRKKPAGPQQPSEYDRNISATWKTRADRARKQLSYVQQMAQLSSLHV